MQKNTKSLKDVQGKIGYEFKNELLLEQAFTRRSYSMENGGEDNEVLEFIGDKVLDLAVVRYLTENYGSDPYYEMDEFASDLSEGELTKLKQKMVQKSALAKRIDELGFAGYLKTGKGDRRNSGDYSDSIKEDLFEAIVGAVTLDCNWNLEKLQDVVETMLCPDSFIEDDEEEDYVSLIYEWFNRRYGENPSFRFFDSPGFFFGRPVSAVRASSIQNSFVGNYNPIQKTCQFEIPEIRTFRASGSSSNEARREVCREAYEFLEKNDLLFTIRDEIENPNMDDAIGQLETLARRGYFSLPEYVYEEVHDEDGNPIWHVECYIEEVEYYFDADESSKKQAKKQAAYDMLMYVLGYDED